MHLRARTGEVHADLVGPEVVVLAQVEILRRLRSGWPAETSAASWIGPEDFDPLLLEPAVPPVMVCRLIP